MAKTGLASDHSEQIKANDTGDQVGGFPSLRRKADCVTRMLSTFQQVDLSKNFYFSFVPNRSMSVQPLIYIATPTISQTPFKPTSPSLRKIAAGIPASCGIIIFHLQHSIWKKRRTGVDGCCLSFMDLWIKPVSPLIRCILFSVNLIQTQRSTCSLERYTLL